jgi:hypothetical protein
MRFASLLPVLSLLPIVACAPSNSTRGDRNRIDFSYHESCLLGCGLDQAVLTDSKERIAVTGPGDEASISVGSSNPKVATFLVMRSCNENECNNDIVVKTHSAGDAKLTLYSAAGELLDSATIHVRSADSVAFQAVDSTGALIPIERLALAPGQSVELWAEPMTKNGAKLLGNQGFDWQSDDPKILGFEDATPSATGKSVQLLAGAAGNTELRVVAGGQSQALSILVTGN